MTIIDNKGVILTMLSSISHFYAFFVAVVCINKANKKLLIEGGSELTTPINLQCLGNRCSWLTLSPSSAHILSTKTDCYSYKCWE